MGPSNPVPSALLLRFLPRLDHQAMTIAQLITAEKNLPVIVPTLEKFLIMYGIKDLDGLMDDI